MQMETQASVGIYDEFPGYRLPTDDELNEALRSALVVVDTNVLLNLYRYNESTRETICSECSGSLATVFGCLTRLCWSSGVTVSALSRAVVRVLTRH